MKSVPQEIIDKTTNCPYDFACLKDSNHEQCKKTDRKDYGLINIIPKTDADIDCNPYLVTFPQLKDSYCTCPVNNYIQTEITNMD